MAFENWTDFAGEVKARQQMAKEMKLCSLAEYEKKLSEWENSLKGIFNGPIDDRFLDKSMSGDGFYLYQFFDRLRDYWLTDVPVFAKITIDCIHIYPEGKNDGYICDGGDSGNELITWYDHKRLEKLKDEEFKDFVLEKIRKKKGGN